MTDLPLAPCPDGTTDFSSALLGVLLLLVTEVGVSRVRSL